MALKPEPELELELELETGRWRCCPVSVVPAGWEG